MIFIYQMRKLSIYIFGKYFKIQTFLYFLLNLYTVYVFYESFLQSFPKFFFKAEVFFSNWQSFWRLNFNKVKLFFQQFSTISSEIQTLNNFSKIIIFISIELTSIMVTLFGHWNNQIKANARVWRHLSIKIDILWHFSYTITLIYCDN
jgi:hypothetical protein